MGKQKIKADVIVIGGGSAGLSTAAGAAQFGLKVVLYERAEMGGDCLNHGCVPSKALLSAAKAVANVSKARAYGVAVRTPVVNWGKVKSHIQGAIDTIAPHDSQERFEGLGCIVIRETAHFKSPTTIISETTVAQAPRIVIATGSRAFIPPIDGLDKTPFLTNETIFNVDVLPEHLIILGGGPIGIEMAQAFTRLGSKVSVIEMQTILARSDQGHAAVVKEALQAEGVEFFEGHAATKISGKDTNIKVQTKTETGKHTIEGSHLLVAVGRRASIEGLNLDKGRVDVHKGHVSVDGSLRSRSNKRVWALGDVAGLGQFTHLAGWHASVFSRRAFFKQNTKHESMPNPAVTYTSPEIAQIGLTEAEAIDQHGKDAVAVSSFPFAQNDRAIAEGSTVGECKLIIKKGKLLGASIVGEGAGEIIQMVGLAMSNGLGVRALTNFISPYPTRTEIVKRAASAYYTPTLFSDKTKRLIGMLKKIP